MNAGAPVVAGGERESARLLLAAGAAFLLQVLAVVVHLGCWHLPLACLLAGLISYRFFPGRALPLFFLVLPLLPAGAYFGFTGYAFNLIALPFFWLAGLLLGSRWRGERLNAGFAGSRVYRLFLAMLWISALFVLLRWSNLTLSLHALLRDTPVSPSQVRLASALFIPVSTLLLYSFAPAIVGLLRQRRLAAETALRWASIGYLPSLALAAAQATGLTGIMSEGWWAVERRFNGGFSDFNAFAFVSGLLFLFHALQLMGAPSRRAGLASALFLPLAMAGIGLSGSRSALVFVLAALGLFLFRPTIRLRVKLAGVALLAALFLLLGGTLRQRLVQMVEMPETLTGKGGGVVRALNFLTNNRLLMLMDGVDMVGRFPLSGIGTGNFYNYRDYLHHRGTFYRDLALNQYLQILVETGLPGLLLFLLFGAQLLGRSRPGAPRTMLVAVAVTLLFSNFLWFPESMLLIFTLVAAAGPEPGPPVPASAGRARSWRQRGAVALLLLAGAANAAAFEALHPLNWCREKEVRYDYGLWQFEKVAPGRRQPKFRWTSGACGVYSFAEKPLVYRVYCRAPLERFPDRRQVVDVYWRGRFRKRIVFTDRRSADVLRYPGDGLLELRVRPAFVPERLGMGPDWRELGVQLYQLNR